jgi:hypothetical protein
VGKGSFSYSFCSDFLPGLVSFKSFWSKYRQRYLMHPESPLEEYRAIKDLFFEFQRNGKLSTCNYGEHAVRYAIITENQIPEDHPVSRHLKQTCSFGLYLDREESITYPLIFVKKGPVPEGFKEEPGKFYGLRAFLTFLDAARGGIAPHMDAIREIEDQNRKTPGAMSKELEYLQNHYCGKA